MLCNNYIDEVTTSCFYMCYTLIKQKETTIIMAHKNDNLYEIYKLPGRIIFTKCRLHAVLSGGTIFFENYIVHEEEYDTTTVIQSS